MKSDERKKYRYLRKNISDKEFKDDMIFKNLLKSIDFSKYNQILIYVSTEEEVDTLNIIKYFLSTKKIAVPKVENGVMDFYYIKSLSELKRGFYNILEPITNNKVEDYSNSICITPGICFSKEGYRIGYGGGFYDKFFSEHKMYSVGLCYKVCLLDKIEIDEYDKKVDVIITE